MRSSHNNLIECLKGTGIQPGSFAYFLSQYVKKKPLQNRSALSYLLSEQMKAQAELIHYHLTRRVL